MDKPKRGSLEAMVVQTGTPQGGNGNGITEERRRTPVGVFEDATKDRRVMLRYFNEPVARPSRESLVGQALRR